MQRLILQQQEQQQQQRLQQLQQVGSDGYICFSLVPRAISWRKWERREKALASAGHMTEKHPEIVGVINWHELIY